MSFAAHDLKAPGTGSSTGRANAVLFPFSCSLFFLASILFAYSYEFFFDTTASSEEHEHHGKLSRCWCYSYFFRPHNQKKDACLGQETKLTSPLSRPLKSLATVLARDLGQLSQGRPGWDIGDLAHHWSPSLLGVAPRRLSCLLGEAHHAEGGGLEMQCAARYGCGHVLYCMFLAHQPASASLSGRRCSKQCFTHMLRPGKRDIGRVGFGISSHRWSDGGARKRHLHPVSCQDPEDEYRTHKGRPPTNLDIGK
ncbi:hypothetical protein J3F83DRAFT_541549 [Trichoderma novae-zelandiae]